MSAIKSYQTPKGNTVTLAYRLDTADEPVIYGSILADEYRIATFDLAPGDVFLDIGAYIGSVGLAVAADFPDVQVVMVEAIPENVTVISESIHLNGWQSRAFVYHAAASGKKGKTAITYGAGDDDSSYQHDNRFVGNLGSLGETQTIKVSNLTLSDIIRLHGAVAGIKIDCEGCEYAFLSDPAVGSVRFITGEYHHGGPERIVALLDKTHHISTTGDAIVGLFWAKRR